MIKKNLKEIKTNLLKDFSNTIPEDIEDKEILVKAFEEYVDFLIHTYEDFSSMPLNKLSIDKDVVQVSNTLINASLEEKKQKLVDDIELKKIEIISKGIFEDAVDVLNGKKIKKDYSKKLEEMQRRLPSVKEKNRILAEKLISEAILDSTFVENKDTQSYSFRLFGLKNRIPNEKGSEENEKQTVPSSDCSYGFNRNAVDCPAVPFNCCCRRGFYRKR